MDEMTAVLDGPRARGAFVLRVSLSAPWGIRVEDDSELTLFAVLSGSCVVTADDGQELSVGAGDVVVVCGRQRYSVADAAGTAPQIRILPGNRCTTMAGDDLHEQMSLGVREWGNDARGSTTMLVASYPDRGDACVDLVSALPPFVVIGRSGAVARVVELLSDEVRKDLAGQQAVLDRLLDVLLISALRTWLDDEHDDAPGWYLAHADPVVGPALRAIHARPAHPWTVAGLAAEVGASRALFASRFHALVGRPPMSYLTERRIALAADALRIAGSSLSEVAEQVGYGSPYALSAAFKRVRGYSPTEHRRATGSTRRKKKNLS
jgi:AraC-like DNA-binding protein